ncbi:hypothetical protein GCM10012275_43890 [Longimycelium tulufanense]|uniref:Coenzyme PQQ synthesis protein A n=1 Tax=Longimycelium tulufanense TaxID=907463 RepID=A0A8J3CIW9_9PSEU|nr:pyrroloquinoline quinone precursor peptide PqqA [Longimycelium tulufanense]GGM68643.1 hypothetical protein GCM10012275_43890 [Longimycelium tulufanense]
MTEDRPTRTPAPAEDTRPSWVRPDVTEYDTPMEVTGYVARR